MTSGSLAVPNNLQRIAERDRERSLVGHTLGIISITGELGHGSHAVVYSGLCSVSRARVAVKVLSRPESLPRLRAEFRALRQVNSPHVVRVHSYGEHPAPHYTMDHVQGDTLDAYLKAKGGKTDVADAIEICRQVCAGLQEIHSAGIVHRDINPSNLLRGHDGHITIIDLGIARRLPRFYDRLGSMTDPALRAITTSVMHSPGYGAPEVIAGEPATEAADLYALGSLMHKLVTGRVYSPSRALDRGIDRLVRSFIEHATFPLLTRRYRSAKDAAHTLKTLADSYDLASSDVIAPAKDIPWYTGLYEDLFVWWATREPMNIRRSTKRWALWLRQSPWCMFVVSALFFSVLLWVFVEPRGPASGPVASEPVASEPVASGGPEASRLANSPAASPVASGGPAASRPVANSPAASRPVASGPAAREPMASGGPAASRLVANSPAASPVASGPAVSGPLANGPAASGLVANSPAASPVASEPRAAVARPRRDRNKRTFVRALRRALQLCAAQGTRVSFRVSDGRVQLDFAATSARVDQCIRSQSLPTSGKFEGTL